MTLVTGYVLLVVALLTASQDYQHRTIALSWLATPRRRRPLAAQAVAVGAVAVGTEVLAQTTWLAAGVIRHSATAMHLDRPADLAALYATTAGTGALLALLGLAAGTIIRRSSAALLALAGCGLAELAVPAFRFRGPVTSALDALSQPVGAGVLRPALALLCWVAVLTAASHAAVGRDLGMSA